jgi:hypothetical protein
LGDLDAAFFEEPFFPFVSTQKKIRGTLLEKKGGSVRGKKEALRKASRPPKKKDAPIKPKEEKKKKETQNKRKLHPKKRNE